MRRHATVLHLDLDAFFAAVEQRDKPSLRGKPVVVGGLGPRGVVSTASYEARVFGVRSAMRTAEARARCPHAAYLGGRFDAYREASRIVMDRLRELSPLVEPMSLDEAFVDLAAADAGSSTSDTTGPAADLAPDALHEIAERVRADVTTRTGGLTASVGIGTSKLMAKIASELAKPDGVRVIAPGTEADVLGPMSVRAIPGVGPATAERLRRIGVTTVDEIRAVADDDLRSLLGKSAGTALAALARGIDPRPVVAEREAKSVSVEDTFETDLTDPRVLADIAERMGRRVAERLARSGLSGRTITLKVRHHDFETHTRSTTLAGPTDDPRVIVRTARALLAEVDTSGGLRLLGVGMSGLADWVQDDLFGGAEDDGTAEPTADSPTADDEAGARADAADATLAGAPVTTAGARVRSDGIGGRRWVPGADVVHDEHGPGWVWGSGLGRVTVRFETRLSGPGPVRTLDADDPALRAGTVES